MIRQATTSTIILLYLTLASYTGQAIALGESLAEDDTAGVIRHLVIGLVFAALLAYLLERDERQTAS